MNIVTWLQYIDQHLTPPPPKKNAHLGDELVTERTCNVCNLDEIYFLLKCTLYNDYIGDLYQSVIKVKIVFRI